MDSFATPGPAARQALLSTGFFRLEYWSGLPFSSPGDLPNPGIQLVSLALAKGLFTTELPRGAHRLLPFFYSCNFRTPTDEPGLLLTGITTFPSLRAHFRYHIDRLLFLQPQLLLISLLIFTEKLFEYVVYSFPFLSPHFTLSYSNPSSPTETTPHTFTKDCEGY